MKKNQNTQVSESTAIFFLSLLLFSFFYLPALAQNKVTWFDKTLNETTENRAFYFKKSPKKDGDRFRVTYYYITGEKFMEGLSLSNEKEIWDGTVTWHYVHGDTMNRITFKKGIPEGEAIAYFRNGKPQSKGNMKGGEKHGHWSIYHENGNLYSVFNYVQGKINGSFNLRDASNETFAEGEFNKGNLIHYRYNIKNMKGSEWNLQANNVKGLEHWKIYRDSALIMESFYQNDRRTGVWKTFSLDGKNLISTFEHENAECNISTKEDSWMELPHRHLPGRFFLPEPMIDSRNPCMTGIFKVYDNDGKLATEKKYNQDGTTAIILESNSAIVADPLEYVKPLSPESADHQQSEMKASDVTPAKDFTCRSLSDGISDLTRCDAGFLGLNIIVKHASESEALQRLSEKDKPAANEVFYFFSKSNSALFSQDFSKFILGDHAKTKIRKEFIPKNLIVALIFNKFKSENLSYLSIESALEKELLE